MIKIQRFSTSDVVIVWVLLLLLLYCLTPQISRSKIRPQMSKCTGNLKQLGNAGALYEGDNAGVRPGPLPMGQRVVEVSWDRPLAIQMGARLGSAGVYEPVANLTQKPAHAASKTLAVFTCPADPQVRGARMVPVVPGSFADGTADGAGICRSYVLNLGTGSPEDVSATASVIPVAKIESAGTVCLIESHGYATIFGQRNIANDTTIVCSKAGSVPADAFANPLAPMHGLKSKPWLLALFYDGHVEVLGQSTITADGGLVMQYIKSGGTPTAETQMGDPAK